MKMRLYASLALCLATVLLSGAPVAAADEKKKCPEGRLASGDCVNPKLAESMRSLSLGMSQPLFSYSAPGRMPDQDYGLHPGTRLQDLNRLFRLPPTGI